MASERTRQSKFPAHLKIRGADWTRARDAWKQADFFRQLIEFLSLRDVRVALESDVTKGLNALFWAKNTGSI